MWHILDGESFYLLIFFSQAEVFPLGDDLLDASRSLDLGCYWILLEWMCPSDEITTWQFYESLFLSSFFDHYSRRCKFNSQPVYRQT